MANIIDRSTLEALIKSLTERPDPNAGGILLPWQMQAEAKLSHYLMDHALQIVEAIREAERYRWLRENSVGAKPEIGILYAEGQESAWVSELDELDSVIDTRMNAVIDSAI